MVEEMQNVTTDGSDFFTSSEPTNEPSNEPTNDSVANEETNADTNHSEEQVSTEPTNPFLTVKYNKEDINLNEDDAKTYVQKGMNYDKVLNERDEAQKFVNENKGYISRLSDLAQKNGADLTTFINNLEGLQNEVALDNEIKALKQERPNLDDKSLMEIATARINGNALKQQNEVAAQQQKAKDDAREKLLADAKEFEALYPDIPIENVINDEKYNGVWELMEKNGYRLSTAYTMWARNEGAKLKSQVDSKSSIAKKNEENKEKSLGSTSNVGSVDGDNDFFKGLSSI